MHPPLTLHNARRSQNTLLVSVFHERFGHKCVRCASPMAAAMPHALRGRNFGALFGLAGLCLLPASLLFSTLLASSLYDAAARAQAAAAGAPVAAGQALYCSGPTCFRAFFLLMAAVAALQVGVAALHWRRMSRFYLRLAAKRANEKNA